MNKERIIKDINNMKQVIQENPELFHDGIDLELLDLLNDIKKYIEEKK